jgi:hypothetical protein
MKDKKRQYKAEVRVGSDQKWYSNALRFDTFEEAEVYAKDLYSRWLSTTAWRVEFEETK